MRELSSAELGLVRHLVTGAEPPPAVAPIDWDVVTTVGAYHRLGPLLYEGVKRSKLDAPRHAVARLEKARHAELARTVRRLSHLDGLEAAAERTGRSLCLLKGAAFSGWLYPDPAVRPMADIDALVRTEDFSGWVSEIEKLGFRRHESSDHATCFRHRHTGVFLELHRSLTSCNRYLGVSTAELLERSQPSGRLRTLCPEDHLLHLCLHASFQHGFRQPAVNAHDANLLVTRPHFDRRGFLERSRKGRLAPWIYGGLQLSHLVFPSEGLSSLALELRDAVPARLVGKLARLNATHGLSPDPHAGTKTPFHRLLWAGDRLATSSLLIEILRPRGESSAPAVLRWAWRATKLLWDHCIKSLPFAMMKQAYDNPRSTPASPGEVRDV